MLTDGEWAERMAVPVNFIQAVGQPDAAAVMAALTMWRLPQGVDRELWLRRVQARMVHRLELRPSGDKSIAIRCMFYTEMLHKCNHLYGGSGTSADPLALARHPWTLTDDEFKDNFELIQHRKLPDTVPDDRARYSTAVQMYAAVPTVAGVLIGLASVPAGAAVGVGIAAAGGIAAISDREKENAQVRQRAQIRANYAGYAAVYAKEAEFREKEGGAARSS